MIVDAEAVATDSACGVQGADAKDQTEWIDGAARNPDWSAADPKDARLERRVRRIDDFGGRVLRVVCDETDETIRVISVMFDRNARRKP
ncbi:MAG: DUF4258 domain-containing protein [Alphaproteobacteria bacterium]|nr:MAG: DUF4258 domain-containing protein [Alphaproteobacteria bacterium]